MPTTLDRAARDAIREHWLVDLTCDGYAPEPRSNDRRCRTCRRPESTHIIKQLLATIDALEKETP